MRLPHLLLVLLAGAAAGAQDTRPSPGSRPTSRPAPGGSVAVHVRHEAEPPRPKAPLVPESYVRTFENDGTFCRSCEREGKLRDESLVVGRDGGVRDVAVSLPRLSSEEGPPPVSIDNEHCRFDPHVAFAPLGKPITLLNSDPLSHNARLERLGGAPFANHLIPPRGSVRTRPLRRPGIYVVRCDIHPWMRATVIGARNPWCAVTGDDGKAVIEGVPPGEGLLLAVWHETLGTVTRRVTVEAGRTLRIDLTEADFRRR